MKWSGVEMAKWMRVEDGGWKMENRGWKIEDGKWRMEDRVWKMEHGGATGPVAPAMGRA